MAKKKVFAITFYLFFTCFTTWVLPQNGYDRLLKGVYGYTESLACIEPKPNQDGTYPDLPHFVEVSPGIFQLAVEGITVSYRASGLVVFDGEGTVTTRSYNIGINNHATAVDDRPFVLQPPLDCEGTYTVDEARSVTVDIDLCTGPVPGETPLTLELGPLPYKGFVGVDPRVVLLYISEPYVTSLNLRAPDGSLVSSAQGSCLSSETLVRLDTDPLNFAQFANGLGGFSSDIVLTNPSSVSAMGSVSFANDDGVPMAVGIIGGAEPLSSVDFTIEPHGSVTISTDPEGPGGVGSAAVSSDGPLGGVIRFNFPGAGIAGVAATGSYDSFIVPVRLQAGGVNTGIAVQNVETEEVEVTFTLMSQEGQELAQTMGTTLAAGGHLAKFIDELFEDYLGDQPSFQGTLVAEVEGGNVAGTALELDLAAGAFTTLPVSQLQ